MHFSTGRKYSCKDLHICNVLAKKFITENTNFMYKNNMKSSVSIDIFQRTFEILT